MGNTIQKKYSAFIKVAEKSGLNFRLEDITKLKLLEHNTPAGTSPFYCSGFIQFDLAVVEPRGDYYLAFKNGRIYHGSNEESFACPIGRGVPHDWKHLEQDMLSLLHIDFVIYSPKYGWA